MLHVATQSLGEAADEPGLAADEAEILDRLRRHAGPVIIDLDETLYLRNSTEDFLASARPRYLAVTLLRLIQLVKPWRVTGRKTADAWRVGILSTLMPWTWWLWRRHVGRTAAGLRNEKVLAVLRERGGEIHVATLGFGPVVRPLLAAMQLGDARVSACRILSSDRIKGKLALLTRERGEDYVRSALVLTDSEDDRHLLDACAMPLLFRWEGSRYESASRGIYFPFDYLSQVKRPGKSPVKRILIEDLSTWLLAAAPLSVTDPRAFAALLCLFFSFWSIYEIGYLENDISAFKREADGKLSAEFSRLNLSFAGAKLWAYAILFGAAAVLALGGDWLTNALIWAGLLLGVRGLYAVYNRIDKLSRIWLYPLLQAARAGAFAVLLPVSLVGVALCGAVALTRWMSYLMYRIPSAGAEYAWPDIPKHLVRLITFAMLVAGLALSPGGPDLSLPVLGVSTLWLLFLARHELRTAVRDGRWLKPR